MNKIPFNGLIKCIFLATLLPIGAVFSEFIQIPIPESIRTTSIDSLSNHNEILKIINIGSDKLLLKELQMPGCIVFCADDGLVVAIFYAKKQPDKEEVMAQNNPWTKDGFDYSLLFNYSNNMHTERQLIIATLSNIFLSLSVRGFICNFEGRNRETLCRTFGVPNSFYSPSWRSPKAFETLFRALTGTFHIYVPNLPCNNYVSANDFYPCIEYYHDLLSLNTRIKLKIYFLKERAQLSSDFFIKNPQAVQALLYFLSENIKTKKPLYSVSKIKGETKISYNMTKKGKDTEIDVAALLNGVWHYTSDEVIRSFVQRIGIDYCKSLNKDEINALFNAVYNFKHNKNIEFCSINPIDIECSDSTVESSE